MSDHDEFFKYSKEQIINALFRFKIKYPASYKAFFMSELEKPYSPFDREIIFLSEKDMELFKKMKKIPEEVVKDWIKNKKRIQDRLNRIKKRLKKYLKQEKHYELRLRVIKDYEKENKEKQA